MVTGPSWYASPEPDPLLLAHSLLRVARVSFFLPAHLLFAESGVSIAHLRLPQVILRAVSQLRLERLQEKKKKTGDTTQERLSLRKYRTGPPKKK